MLFQIYKCVCLYEITLKLYYSRTKVKNDDVTKIYIVDADKLTAVKPLGFELVCQCMLFIWMETIIISSSTFNCFEISRYFSIDRNSHSKEKKKKLTENNIDNYLRFTNLLRENNTKMKCFLFIVNWNSVKSSIPNATMTMALDILSANQYERSFKLDFKLVERQQFTTMTFCEIF